MATLYIKNLTSNNISVDGEGATPVRIYISPSVGANYATVSDTLLLGDTTACTALSNLITNSKVAVTIGSLSGTSVTAAGMLKYASGTQWDTNASGALEVTDASDNANYAQTRQDLRMQRLAITGLAVDTLNDEVSAALGGVAADLFVPQKLIVHLEDVGAGAAATGDFEITVGTATGGTQILTATACTNCKDLNDCFTIAFAGLQDAIAGNATIFVKCTTKDTSAGAGHLADAYLIGELIVAGA